MPIYEFKCKKCSKKFEDIVFSSNYSKVSCPECNSKNVHKLISVFGFKSGSKFKGSTGSSCNSCHANSCSSCKV
ncbi:MAG: FmdB family zinc ribbon protein [Candidatus Firestonebacteria bacterium]